MPAAGGALDVGCGSIFRQCWQSWLCDKGLPEGLVWVCIADMAAVYSAAVAAMSSPHGLPSPLQRLLEDVVGISVHQLSSPGALVGAIARPVVLLLLLQTLR